MKKSKEIYVVVKHYGMMYDDCSVVECAFTNLETAEKYVDELNDKSATLTASFLKCEDNAMYQIRILSDAFIEKYYPDVWKKMNDEESEGDEDFWLEVGDIEFGIESDRDGLFQFAKEQGVPDEDIADMKTYYEYMDSEECGGLPTYTLMKNVELFED